MFLNFSVPILVAMSFFFCPFALCDTAYIPKVKIKKNRKKEKKETWEKPWRDWISWLVWESLSVPHQKSEVAAKVSLLILISIFYWVSRFGSEQRNPHFPHPLHLFQLICGDTELLPSHPRDIISSAGPGSEQEPPPSKTWLEYLTQKASRRHPSQMPRNPDQDKCQKMDKF